MSEVEKSKNLVSFTELVIISRLFVDVVFNKGYMSQDANTSMKDFMLKEVNDRVYEDSIEDELSDTDSEDIKGLQAYRDCLDFMHETLSGLTETASGIVARNQHPEYFDIKKLGLMQVDVLPSYSRQLMNWVLFFKTVVILFMDKVNIELMNNRRNIGVTFEKQGDKWAYLFELSPPVDGGAYCAILEERFNGEKITKKMKRNHSYAVLTFLAWVASLLIIDLDEIIEATETLGGDKSKCFVTVKEDSDFFMATDTPQ